MQRPQRRFAVSNPSSVFEFRVVYDLRAARAACNKIDGRQGPNFRASATGGGHELCRNSPAAGQGAPDPSANCYPARQKKLAPPLTISAEPTRSGGSARCWRLLRIERGEPRLLGKTITPDRVAACKRGSAPPGKSNSRRGRSGDPGRGATEAACAFLTVQAEFPLAGCALRAGGSEFCGSRAGKPFARR